MKELGWLARDALRQVRSGPPLPHPEHDPDRLERITSLSGKFLGNGGPELSGHFPEMAVGCRKPAHRITLPISDKFSCAL